MGVSVRAKSASSLASGMRAMVIWYLIERACFSAITSLLGMLPYQPAQLGDALERVRRLQADAARQELPIRSLDLRGDPTLAELLGHAGRDVGIDLRAEHIVERSEASRAAGADLEGVVLGVRVCIAAEHVEDHTVEQIEARAGRDMALDRSE